ncbi:rod shape-determining protein MreC [Sulfuricella denitrificans skB26]|uniref:Cell shape-determining protein MreC n=1 Tax=Sulfuricella denitrificans (strain DSM 22764 / NBRC 105220 / skB26) TaxID=1163617 RepID=S6AZL0_SULDS|nr:rod shape-determining protein MreC [Sulfuricella denitrificans]BAN33947.1 rod shape-determining protein MreC [Sulfuricella denitrificans skB26]
MDHQAPPFFNHGPSPLARFVFFALISLVLMLLDARLNALDSLRQIISVAVAPLQSLAMTPVELLDRTGDFFVTQARLQNENAMLSQRQLVQSAQLQRLQAMQAENVHLRNILSIQQQRGENVVAAEIVYTGRDPFSQKITVNKGLTHKVQAGQPALDEIGVIGQVTRVYPFSSEITLLTDKDQAIPVEIVRNGARAIAFGHGQDGALELPFMAANADIQNGDTLVTSGIDGVYPAGLPVAVVSKIERNASFAKITCIPSAGVNRHKQLLILVGEVQRFRKPDPVGTGKTDSKTPVVRKNRP